MAIGGYPDKHALSTDSGFQGAVEQSLIQACGSIVNEATTAGFHRERALYATQVINSPGTYMPLFAMAVANDASVISDATQAGTVALAGASAGVLAAQAAKVTDAHIDTAISSVFNSFAGIIH